MRLGKFSGILLVSDFDGTFFERGFIPKRNIDAVNYFIENGGYFTLNTARPMNSIAEYLPRFSINAPVGLSNGAVIYDYTKKDFLSIEFLAPHAVVVAREVYEKFPGVRIELYTPEGMELARDANVLDECTIATRPHGAPVNIYATNSQITRIVYVAHKEIIKQVALYVREHAQGKYDTIDPVGNFFNVIPQGVTKASALQQITDMLKIPMKNTYCIGDSYNDFEMLLTAGISACPADAQEKVRQICKVITCPMSGGAIADLIEYIERRVEAYGHSF